MSAGEKITVGVAYADAQRPVWQRLDVAPGTTVQEAIERSGVLERHPDIDLTAQKVGVFGKFVKLDAPLQPGDRVEIYRPITCDPALVPRRDGAGEDD